MLSNKKEHEPESINFDTTPKIRQEVNIKVSDLMLVLLNLNILHQTRAKRE